MWFKIKFMKCALEFVKGLLTRQGNFIKDPDLTLKFWEKPCFKMEKKWRVILKSLNSSWTDSYIVYVKDSYQFWIYDFSGWFIGSSLCYSAANPPCYHTLESTVGNLWVNR